MLSGGLLMGNLSETQRRVTESGGEWLGVAGGADDGWEPLVPSGKQT